LSTWTSTSRHDGNLIDAVDGTLAALANAKIGKYEIKGDE